MAKVRGKGSASAKLKRMGPDVEKQIGAVLYAAADTMVVEAQISITTGAVSGKRHVPSRPGEPPNNDTGVLANNIEAVLMPPTTVHVQSNAPYSKALEFGTSKIAERPFMRPAAAKTKKEIGKLLAAGARKILGGGKVTVR